MPFQVLSVLAFLVFLTCAAHSEDVETLPDLVEEALAKNPDLMATRESVFEAEAAIRQARSAHWPSATGTGVYSRPSYIPEFEVPAGAEGQPRTIKFGTENQINAELKAIYPFFTWGRTRAGIELSKIGKETAEDIAEKAKRALTLALTRVYFGLALAHESQELAEEIRDLIGEQVEMVRRRKETGYASDFDLLRMEVELAQAESEVLARNTQTRRLKVSLNRLTGRSIEQSVSISTTLPGQPPGEVDTLSLDRAVDRHLDLKILMRGYRQYELQKSITRSQYLRPMPAAFFSYMVRNGLLPDVEELQDSWSVGVSVTIPIFDGFLTKHTLEKLEAGERRLRAEELSVRSEIGENIVIGRTNFAEALEQIELVEKQQKQAQKGYEIARDAYQSGALSSLDLIEAQRLYRRANLRMIATRFDAVVKWCAMRDAEYLPYVEFF